MSTTTIPAPATRKQIDYIKDLIDEREVAGKPKLKETAENLSKRLASAWIERLKELPREKVQQSSGRSFKTIETNVPAGHYAVTGQDGTTDFYCVNRPTEGKWAGYIFVKLQLSDEYQNVPFRNSQAILDKIEKDGPEAASKRYGKELGRCGVCKRTLTNNDSIERGIGPVCAAKHDWTF